MADDYWLPPRPAVKAAVAILAAKLGVPVVHKVPNTRPASFVKVSRVGGSRPNPVTDFARILVECWAPSIGAVEVLAADAEAALSNAIGEYFSGAFVRGFGDIQGPVDFPDPDVTDQLRYQFTGSLNISMTS